MGNIILFIYLFAIITPDDNSIGSLSIYYKSARTVSSRISFQS
jgi:hypothetical protein